MTPLQGAKINFQIDSDDDSELDDYMNVEEGVSSHIIQFAFSHISNIFRAPSEHALSYFLSTLVLQHISGVFWAYFWKIFIYFFCPRTVEILIRML